MRRQLAAALMVVFSFALIAPVLQASNGPEARLPECCRRAGIHRCSMLAASGDKPGFAAAPCPRFPGFSAAAQGAFATMVRPQFTAAPAVLAIDIWQCPARRSTRAAEADRPRGPPSPVPSLA